MICTWSVHPSSSIVPQFNAVLTFSLNSPWSWNSNMLCLGWYQITKKVVKFCVVSIDVILKNRSGFLWWLVQYLVHMCVQRTEQNVYICIVMCSQVAYPRLLTPVVALPSFQSCLDSWGANISIHVVARQNVYFWLTVKMFYSNKTNFLLSCSVASWCL